MDAGGFGSQTAADQPATPGEPKERLFVGTVTASHKMLTLQALSSSRDAVCKERLPGPRKGFWGDLRQSVPQNGRVHPPGIDPPQNRPTQSSSVRGVLPAWARSNRPPRVPEQATCLCSPAPSSCDQGMKTTMTISYIPNTRRTTPLRSRPGKPNQRKGQNEKFMNFAHFCEFWCFSLGKQARFTWNFCSGMPL